MRDDTDRQAAAINAVRGIRDIAGRAPRTVNIAQGQGRQYVGAELTSVDDVTAGHGFILNLDSCNTGSF